MTIKFLSRFLVLGIIFISTACTKDDVILKVPTTEDAGFVYTFDEINPNKVVFKAMPSESNWYTHWGFGDNSSAEGYDVSKVFLKKGDYNVRFKIFTEGGVAESTQTIVINEDFKGPNILKNGAFNGNANWTVLPMSNGVNVAFENGGAHWTGGSWGQVGIYQAVNVLADNVYQLSMDIKGGPLSNSWFEVYVGTKAPVVGGPDYVDGGMRLSLNTWEGCGATPFDGDFADYTCKKDAATFKFPKAGTVYIVLRGGGENYGNGLTIDNVAIRSLQ
jgi:hypothetical protein